MKVCIAEKPSVAKDLAEVLGAKSRKDGYFEGNGYQITWTFGHLCTLKEPHEYDGVYKWWNLDRLPIMPKKFGIKVMDNPGVKKQFSIIEKLVKEAEFVINCGDAGQEGELIQRWVLQKAGYKSTIKRLWISSLTEEAIKDGFNNLRDGHDFDNLYHAGSSRAIGDWLLGMNGTRLFTLKYGKEKQVLSIGRVQTPTLALIVDRHKAIENFESRTYWELKTTYRDVLFNRFVDTAEEDVGKSSNSYNSIEEAQQDLARIKEYDFEVDDIIAKKGKEGAARLFDLTSLQVEGNKKFSLSAEQTLNVIQGLYEKKLVTYPRVDTTYLPDDMYPKIPGILKGLAGYDKYTGPLLSEKITKSKKVFDNAKITDHHAIIPTGVKALVNGVDKQVYDLITRRFIAVFYPDCAVLNTTVLGNVNTIKFKATGKQILDPGWRVVYDFDASNLKNETTMPSFQKGEKGPHVPDLQERETQPPKPFTEATLLRSMESAGKNVEDENLRELMKENGIGRPSTRANIIETLFRRKYITRKRKTVVPTNVGIDLINIIDNKLLKSAELTGQWEHKLRQIEQGDYSAGKFIGEMKRMVDELVMEIFYDKSGKKIGYVPPQDQNKKRTKKRKEISCPKCNTGKVVKGKNAYGCLEYKNGCDFVIPFTFMEKKLTDKQIEDLIAKRKTGVIKGFVLADEKKNGNLVLNNEFNVEFIEQAEKELICPKCKAGKIIEGNTAYGCLRFKEGCDFKVPFVFMGKKLTKPQIEQLIEKGKTKKIKGLELNGEKVEGVLSFDAQFMLRHS